MDRLKIKLLIYENFWLKYFPILINKIEQSLRLNPRIAPLLDMGLMILVIAYGIMKIKKSLGVEMWYSMKMLCTKISCRGKKRKKKTHSR